MKFVVVVILPMALIDRRSIAMAPPKQTWVTSSSDSKIQILCPFRTNSASKNRFLTDPV